MTAADSKDCKKGSRIFWGADPADGGRIKEINWDAVTIAWDNAQVARPAS